ncbi:MAG: N-acetylneuraminate synthase family protein [Bacteroidota bacterium]
MNHNPFKGKHGPLLIAEIGGNHEGNFEYAKELTQLAIDTDVDFVKFQIYTGNTLVSKVENPVRNKHFKKFELHPEQHIELAEMIQAAGIGYMSSVWDMSALDWIDDYIPVYKIGSGDMTAYPVLRQTAELGKPMIVSTGLSHEKEVLEMVEFIQNIDERYKQKEYLALLQCTSMYPITSGDAHLAVMERFQQLTGLTVGYSDHTEGSKALFYAVAMGAEILEFHFTDSREHKQFRDHKVSLTPVEVKNLIEEIQLINAYKGNATKQPLPIEINNQHDVTFRRAVYPSKDIKKGEQLSEDNLVTLRPAHGIDARFYAKCLGKTAKKDLSMHQKLEWKDLI